MTSVELEQLSGAEVAARLVQRGLPATQAQSLVERRDTDRMARDAILRVINLRKD